MRIDQLLVQRGLASTRSQAQRLIAAGVQWRQDGVWRAVGKNGDEVPGDAEVQLLDDSEARFVSRGGLKLQAALQQAGVSAQGLACLDVGQSTGGFTDCLLQMGARSVVGVDVGCAQLHPSLRSDPRVLCVENVNARTLSAEHLLEAYAHSLSQDGPFEADDASVTEDGAAASGEFAPEFDLVVMDLSFISQTLVLPAIVPLMKPGAVLLSLVKPQFELQPGQVGKGGIVRDASLYAVVEQRIRLALADLDLRVSAWFDSPIEGGDGNREFFVCAAKRSL